MPVRVGIDLVAVAAVEQAFAEHGERYLERVFTPSERARCVGPGGQPDCACLAACFAAKEAAVKALRPPRDTALPWLDVELREPSPAALELRLGGAAARLAAAGGLDDVAVSVSLTRAPGYAAAVVIARSGA